MLERQVPTLLDILGDGVRHPDVAAAIKEQAVFESEEFQSDEALYRLTEHSSPRIGELEMQFDHDVLAMKYVLKNFKPLDNSHHAAWEEIVQSEDLWSMPASLEAFNEEVQFTGQMDNSLKKPSRGTGSPQKPE
jgi:hypothetical protein